LALSKCIPRKGTTWATFSFLLTGLQYIRVNLSAILEPSIGKAAPKAIFWVKGSVNPKKIIDREGPKRYIGLTLLRYAMIGLAKRTPFPKGKGYLLFWDRTM